MSWTNQPQRKSTRIADREPTDEYGMTATDVRHIIDDLTLQYENAPEETPRQIDEKKDLKIRIAEYRDQLSRFSNYQGRRGGAAKKKRKTKSKRKAKKMTKKLSKRKAKGNTKKRR